VFLALSLYEKPRTNEQYYEGPEALQWLKDNKNPSALASNRFGPTVKAIAFVEKLYEAGAQVVQISEGCIRDDRQTIELEGGPYADGLVVALPTQKAKRKAVLNICTRESMREGFGDAKNQVRNNMMFLWWD
jgi:hypothetical protein